MGYSLTLHKENWYQITNDILTYENTCMTINNTTIDRKVFVHGEKIYVNFEGMEGFVEKESKVSLGLDLSVLNYFRDTLYYTPDIFSDYDNATKASIKTFGTYLSAAYPYLNDNNYVLKINIWDKIGEGTFQFEMPFNVVQNEGISVNNQYCDYQTIGLFDPKPRNVITSNKILVEGTFQLYLQGISNFKNIESKVYPGMLLEFTDYQGNTQNSDNVLASISESGIYAKVFNRYFSTNLSLGSEKSEKETETPGEVTAIIFDTKSKAEIEVIIKVILIDNCQVSHY